MQNISTHPINGGAKGEVMIIVGFHKYIPINAFVRKYYNFGIIIVKMYV